MATLSATVSVRIPFHDVDMMNVTWHGHYIKYFELARCALLDKIQYNYGEMKASGYIWPVVDLKVRYVRPARFGQEVCITASVKEYENRLVLDYRVCDQVSGEKLTKGQTIQVAVSVDGGELQLVSPAVLREKVENALCR